MYLLCPFVDLFGTYINICFNCSYNWFGMYKCFVLVVCKFCYAVIFYT
jgi:hypothetical protein